MLDDLEAKLRLRPGDLWELSRFHARFAGANLRLSATITNASAIRNWKVFQTPSRVPPGALQDSLRQLADAVEQIHFVAPPELVVETRGDARDWRSLAVRLKLASADADTPWGMLQGGSLSAQLAPATSNELSRAQIELQARYAQTRWAAITNLVLALRLISTEPAASAVDADLDLAAGYIATQWGGATNAHLNARWTHSWTNAVPLAGRGEIQLTGARTKWGGARSARLVVRFSPTAEMTGTADASWGWWTNLAPHALAWEGRVTGFQSSQPEADEILCGGQWHAPQLQVTQFLARLYGGKFSARADLNVSTRQLGFSGSSDFDLRKMAGWLPTNSQPWLSELSWQTPPAFEVEGGLTLPVWTNCHPDWRAEIGPTVRVARPCSRRQLRVSRRGGYPGGFPLQLLQRSLAFAGPVGAAARRQAGGGSRNHRSNRRFRFPHSQQH